MDTNPFQSPELPGPPDPLQPGYDPRQVGRARQVPIVAVLMIVHGAILCLAGICLMVLAFFVGRQFADAVDQQQRLNPNAQQFNPDTFRWVMEGMYGAFGGVVLISGLLSLFAGIRNYSFRGRILGIVSLVGGMASILTCYCAPISLALLVYGLIIYSSQDAELAFRWQEGRARGGTI